MGKEGRRAGTGRARETQAHRRRKGSPRASRVDRGRVRVHQRGGKKEDRKVRKEREKEKPAEKRGKGKVEGKSAAAEVKGGCPQAPPEQRLPRPERPRPPPWGVRRATSAPRLPPRPLPLGTPAADRPHPASWAPRRIRARSHLLGGARAVGSSARAAAARNPLEVAAGAWRPPGCAPTPRLSLSRDCARPAPVAPLLLGPARAKRRPPCPASGSRAPTPPRGREGRKVAPRSWSVPALSSRLAPSLPALLLPVAAADPGPYLTTAAKDEDEEAAGAAGGGAGVLRWPWDAAGVQDGDDDEAAAAARPGPGG